jgi:hypothetical protein
MQIGTLHALDDARDVVTVLAFRDVLEMIASRLPGHLRNFDGDSLDSVLALLESPICPADVRAHALVLVMNRLAAPWQLIRLALKAADTDDAARVAVSSYALAVTIVLGEIERLVEELRFDLKRGATIAMTSLLKCIHDAVRGVRTELDLSAETGWARRLAGIRAEISNVLKAEIESVPGRIRRLLRPRSPDEVERPPRLDLQEVAETEAMIDFVGACRNYAGELAISEVTLRTFQEIQQYLDTFARALLDGLRTAGEAERPFRKSQVDAAIRFCGKAFGQDYAALLVKAAEMAANPDRRAPARA